MHDDACPAVAYNDRNQPVLFCWYAPGHAGDHHDRDHHVRWRPEAPGQIQPRRLMAPPGGPGKTRPRKFHFKRVSRFEPEDQIEAMKAKAGV